MTDQDIQERNHDLDLAFVVAVAILTAITIGIVCYAWLTGQ